jgi:hypothetical protein
MASSAPTVEDRALALRADALLICEQAAWLPQCIGTDQFLPGVPEIYEEMRCLQRVRAVRVSEALIACCLRHGMWTSLFEDVEARIWSFLGDRDRAEARWSELLHHENRQLQVIAKQALASLQRKVDSGEQLAMEVDQAMDRNEIERVVGMLLVALMDEDEPDTLENVLEVVALQWPMPPEIPWDRGLFTNHLVLDLFERQLQNWEAGNCD